MSDNSQNFVPSFFSPEQTSSDPSQSRTFQLDAGVSRGRAQLKTFQHDSEKARNFAQSNVKRAREGVKEIIQDAINKAKKQVLEIKEQARKEGLESGYTEGFKNGEQAARDEFSPFLATLQKSIQDLSVFRKNMYDKVEREMLEMVVGLAKKVVQFELTTRENSVQEIIRLAVQEVVHKESMIIKVNPADKKHAEDFRPEIKEMFHEIKNIQIEEHSGVERGGCMIETNFGTIDARIDKLTEQIDNILHLAPPSPEDKSPEEPA